MCDSSVYNTSKSILCVKYLWHNFTIMYIKWLVKKQLYYFSKYIVNYTYKQ